MVLFYEKFEILLLLFLFRIDILVDLQKFSFGVLKKGEALPKEVR